MRKSFLVWCFLCCSYVFALDLPVLFLGEVQAMVIPAASNQNGGTNPAEHIKLTVKAIDFQTKMEFAFIRGQAEYKCHIDNIAKEEFLSFLSRDAGSTSKNSEKNKSLYISIEWSDLDPARAERKVYKSNNQKLDFTLFPDNRLKLILPRLQARNNEASIPGITLVLGSEATLALEAMLMDESIQRQIQLLEMVEGGDGDRD